MKVKHAIFALMLIAILSTPYVYAQATDPTTVPIGITGILIAIAIIIAAVIIAIAIVIAGIVIARARKK